MAALDIERFRALLATTRFGRELIFEPVVGSTMDLAREAAGAGAADGAVALADEQTAGRGRMGRSWVAPPAANLLATIVLTPPPAILRQIAMMAPLAICRAIEEGTGLRPDIKWPNDVQVAGKKLAGILIETDMGDPNRPLVLVGAGINVNFDPRGHPEIRDGATSLRVELGRAVDREALLAAFLAHFERLYDDAIGGESPFSVWRERLVTIGQNVHATWRGGSAAGLAEDVSAEGALLVRTASGELVVVEAGDVTLRV